MPRCTQWCEPVIKEAGEAVPVVQTITDLVSDRRERDGLAGGRGSNLFVGGIAIALHDAPGSVAEGDSGRVGPAPSVDHLRQGPRSSPA
jgi:hypothetical protein